MQTRVSYCVLGFFFMQHDCLSLALRNTSCRGHFQAIARIRLTNVHAVNRCLLLVSSASLFSRHGLFIVASAELLHRSNGFTQFCTHLNVHNQFDMCLLLFDASSIQQWFHHRQWSVRCKCATSCAIVRCRDFLDAENSFLCQDWSCSQSIRHRIGH